MKTISFYLVLLSVTGFFYSGCSETDSEGSDLILIGHRGLSISNPENSEEAITALIKSGCRYLETDITISGDDSVILFHDDETDRLTPFSGSTLSFPANELREGFRSKMGGTLLTFSQFASRYGNQFDEIYLDLKSGQGDAIFKLIRQTINIAKTTGITQKLIFTCPYTAGLDSVLKISPGIKTAIDNGPEGVSIAIQKNYPVVLIEQSDLNPYLYSLARGSGVKIIGYTINSLPEIQKAIESGVNGVMTDNPSLFRDAGY
ncbi:MAG: glycerophosphodiester phosphodiesterase [Bacteroidetes bacterium]|nr:glycerophosphodiester phosphodiesterase [Bacteroidota bacterium]